MNIVDETSLDYLDEITNGGEAKLEQKNDVRVQPTIRDVGDVGIKTGIRF